ncbi:MAG: flagellar M-ring protein FliF [Rickettsiales bacterium]|nr:flagellar M-ring protein FliF [Rickettsiales bacterium]
MGKAKIGAMLAMSTLLLAFFLFVAFRLSSANMVPLYTSMSLEDSSKVVAELEQSGTPYELIGNGTGVMVPSDKVLRLRMTLAEQGLPSGASIVGYEIFDRQESFGSSNYIMSINVLRALEGELSRTIGSIAGIETARVHLVMPKRELFTRDKDKPSASVTIKMRGGHSLEKNEVTAITHLIASAVPGLEPSKVTVVDSHGKLLARGSGEDSLDATAATAMEYRTAYENQMRDRLEELLEKVVGAGKVRVKVAADMNFDRIITNSEKFDPDGQVARSVQSTTGREDSKDKAAADNVTAANNLPQASTAGAGGASSDKLSENSTETTNFEISKTVQNHVREGGTVNKLSVAVLVDGIYTTDAEGNQSYAPRSEEELNKLKTLINSAVGFDEKRGDRIEVVNMQFTDKADALEEESFFARFKLEMQSIIQTLIIGVVAILAILLVLRPAVTQLVRGTQTPSGRVAGELAALEAPGMAAAGAAPARIPGGGGGNPASLGAEQGETEILIDVANIKGGMKSSSMNKINEIVDKYPEETMGVLRQWMMK